MIPKKIHKLVNIPIENIKQLFQSHRLQHEKNSRVEPPLASDILIIGKLYILNEIYPSIEYENMNGTPLAFLGFEKFLRIHID